MTRLVVWSILALSLLAALLWAAVFALSPSLDALGYTALGLAVAAAMFILLRSPRVMERLERAE